MDEVQINVAELEWEPAPGYPVDTRWKVLRRDARGNPATVLLMLPPGLEIDNHSHVTLEQHYVLEGAYESSSAEYAAGSYRMIPPHTDHGPFRSKSGALVLVMW